MASTRQIDANRANARKSTGPTSEKGKAVSRSNAVKHGLQAELLVLPGEDKEVFNSLCDRVFDEVQPVGMLEEKLAEEIAISFWRLRRARLAEAGIYRSSLNEEYTDEYFPLGLGNSFILNSVSADLFGKYVRYEKSIENSLYRAIENLKRHQAERVNATNDDPVINEIDAEPTPIAAE